MPVKAIPDGYHTVTPYLMVKDAARFIEFMTAVFDAQLPQGAWQRIHVRGAHALCAGQLQ